MKFMIGTVVLCITLWVVVFTGFMGLGLWQVFHQWGYL